MFNAAWKSLLGHKLRLLMSALAIVLGVAFVAGSFVFTDLLRSSFDAITKGTVADVNVAPAGTYDPNQITSGLSASTLQLTQADLAGIRAVDGVQSATGVLSTSGIYVIGKNGKVVTTGGAPGIGSNWFVQPAFQGQVGIVLKSGHAPIGVDEVVLDPSSLQRSGYALGDSIKLVTPSESAVTRTVVGTGTWGNGGSAGASYVFFSDTDAQALFLKGADAWQSAWVVAKPGVDTVALAKRVAAVVPKGYEATGGQAASDATLSAINTGLGYVNTFLLVFGAIALIVATFLIVNTFTILVAQRSRELALLRALGARRTQVRLTVLFEAFVIGLLGATMGLAGGWLLALGILGVFKHLGIDLGDVTPHLGSRAIIASYGIGLLVTMAAAWFPAHKASQVPPVAAMTGESGGGTEGLSLRLAGWGLLGVVGATGLVLGLWTHVPQPLWFIGLGALLVLLGVAGISPLLGRPLIWLIGHLWRRGFGEVGKLAQLNAQRQPRRTAATASALMIGLTLMTLMSVLGTSMSRTIDQDVRQGVRGDFVIQSATFGTVPASVAVQARQVTGVAQAIEVRSVIAVKADSPVDLNGILPSSFNQATAQTLTGGRLFSATDEIVVSDRAASRDNIRIGDAISVVNPATRTPVTLHVVGTYTSKAIGLGGGYLTSLDTIAGMGNTDQDSRIVVTMRPGADKATVQQGLDAATAELPMVTALDQDAYINAQTSSIDRLLRVIDALLGLAVVIAILGIVNTLALSVIERTREIGLLRAIAMKRREVWGMITLESVIVAVLGSVLGMGLGLCFGIALQQALKTRGLSHLGVPWLQLLGFLVVSALVGVLAAVWPAYRASRLNVLAAIATE